DAAVRHLAMDGAAVRPRHRHLRLEAKCSLVEVEGRIGVSYRQGRDDPRHIGRQGWSLGHGCFLLLKGKTGMKPGGRITKYVNKCQEQKGKKNMSGMRLLEACGGPVIN